MKNHGATSSLEIERKYEVIGDEALPAFELPGVASVTEARALLVASYWDTPGRDLGRAGLALRSRSGGADAGWHVKARGPEGVLELHWPAADEVPAGAYEMLRERLGSDSLAGLAPVATVQSDRIVRRLLGAGGHLLVEFADDRVLATDHGGPGSAAGPTMRAWREWEAELGEGAGAELLTLAEPQLIAAGARPSLSEAKIQRTLGMTVSAARKRGAGLSELLACALADLADRIAAVPERADQDEALEEAEVLALRARDLIKIFRKDLGVTRDEVKAATRALKGEAAVSGMPVLPHAVACLRTLAYGVAAARRASPSAGTDADAAIGARVERQLRRLSAVDELGLSAVTLLTEHSAVVHRTNA